MPTYSKPFYRGSKLDRTKVQAAFVEFVGQPALNSCEALLKRCLPVLKKAFPGHTFTLKNEGLWGGDIGHVGWKASISGGLHGGYPVISLRVISKLKADPNRAGSFTTDYLVITEPDFELGVGKDPGSVYPFVSASLTHPPTMRDVNGLIEKMGRDALLNALGGPMVGKRTGVPTIKDVREFIQRRRTYFDLDESTPTTLMYSTREHGDVGDERPGSEDIAEARGLRKELIEEFGAGSIRVGIEPVDEWVHLTVTVGGSLRAGTIRLAAALPPDSAERKMLLSVLARH